MGGAAGSRMVFHKRGGVMDEPQKESAYKGHRIRIDLKKVADRWHWSYQIDGSSPFELLDTGESSEKRALLYAWTDARGRIDNQA